MLKHYIAYSMYIGGSLNLIGYDNQSDRDGAFEQYIKYGMIVDGEPPNHNRISPYMVCKLNVDACAVHHPVH